jgi:hypothetical protein
VVSDIEGAARHSVSVAPQAGERYACFRVNGRVAALFLDRGHRRLAVAALLSARSNESQRAWVRKICCVNGFARQPSTDATGSVLALLTTARGGGSDDTRPDLSVWN